MIDASHICYVNSESGEIVFLMCDEMMDDLSFGIDDDDDDDGDDDDEDGGASDNKIPDWRKEALAEEKANIAKVNSWGEEFTIIIEKQESHEAFEIMEDFVESAVPAGGLKDELEEALLRRKPFRNFNAIIENSNLSQAWFDFKQDALEKYVMKKISDA